MLAAVCDHWLTLMPFNLWFNDVERNIMTTTLHRPIEKAPLPVVHTFDEAYDRLAAARLEYEMLRTQSAPLGALAEARAALHRARAAMAAQRRGLTTT